MKVVGIGIILCLVWSPEAQAQVFPGATAGDKDLYVAVGGVATTISAAVTASSTVFPVASVANMVPYELLVIDNEIVEECAVSISPLQISIGKNSCPGADGRGIGGTSAASHANGARITDLVTGEHHNAERREIEAVETALGANLSNIPGTANGNPVPITKGGTGATTQPAALANIIGVTPPLPANGLCFTQIAGPMSCIGPGTAGTVLTSVGPANLPVWGAGGGGGGGNVSSVFGRTGTVAAQAGDYTAALVTNAVDQTQTYANPAWITALAWTKITGAPPFITNPMISAGDFIVGGTGGTPMRLAVPGTGTFCPNWAAGGFPVTWVTCPGGGGSSGITSIGITMPSGFNVSGSPLIANGVIAITGAGNATQYINGLGQLTTFPTFVTSIFSRTGAVTAQAGDYTTTQVTEGTNLYFTTARVYAALSGTSPIVFNASTGNISCPTCGTGGGGAVTSVFGRTGVVVAASGDYNATQVTNAENITNKDVNGGYVGRSAAGNATIPGTWTGIGFASSDTTHTSLMMLIPGLNTNFASPIVTGDWGLFLDSGNGNKLTRQDSLGNKVVVESAGGAAYTQSFTAVTSVVLTHNFNLTNIAGFTINCFDGSNVLIFPSTVTATNANSVTVTFAVATTGSCTIATGGPSTGGGGGGGIAGPGTTVTGYVPQWNGTTGAALSAGLPVTQAALASALVETGTGGTIAAGLVPILNQSTTGNAATATALAATPTQCTSGQFATGIAASGAANCNTPAGSGNVVTTGTPANGNLTQFSGATSITNGNLSGDITTAGTLVTTLATVNAGSGSCGTATAVCQVTTNAKGLVTTQAAVTITGLPASAVGLTNVTNNAQTQAAIVPNTIPTAGQLHVGNAGGTAFGVVSMSGDANLASTGALTLATVNSTTGSCGTATAVCQITSNGKGLITAQAAVTITGLPASAVGLGLVTNNAQTQAAIVPNTTPLAGQILVGNAPGTAYAATTMSGDATLASTGALTLATVNTTTGSCGDATHVCQITSNGKGLITAQSAVAITGGGGGITGPGTTVTGNVPQWNNTTGTALSAGLPVATVATASSLVETLAGGTIDPSFVTALAATPTQCSGTGQFATGVTAAGNANCAQGFADGTTANGVVIRTAAGTTINRVIANGNPITVTNGDGVAGNPTVGCATCVTATPTMTANAVILGNGTKTLTPAAVDTTTTHALFATATQPAFRAIATTDLPAIAVGGLSLGAESFPCNVTAATAAATACGFGVFPQNSQSAAYTLVITDQGSQIYHPSADTTARTWTIPANASVAYPVGTCISFFNDTSAGVVTIAITTDTLVLAGPGTTGSRTLAANGVATACKVTATRWIINGTGLT